MMPTTDLYGKLADNDPAARLSAAEKLISSLKESSTEEMEYAIGRLFKGLASRRKSARLGFGVALTELLSVLTNIDVKDLLSLLEKHTAPSGNINGAEERDFYFARIFGVEALLKSRVLSRESVTDEDFQSVINLLLVLAQSKSWLRESCAKILCEVILRYPAHTSSILSKIHETNLAKTSDGVAIILTASSLPNHPKLPCLVWRHGCPLHLSSLSLLSKVLRQSSSSEKEKAPSEIWKARIHFVWDLIMDKYASNSDKVCPFADFWKTVVDEGLFSASSSPERKYWGFQLFERALRIVSTSQISSIFSQNFLRCMINQLGDSERYNYKAAKKASSAIVSAAEKRPEISYSILKILLSETINFDTITKTKTVEGLLKTLDEIAVIKTVDLFRMMAIDCEELESPKTVNSRRQWIADHLLLLIRNTKREEPSIQKILSLLVEIAYFPFPSKPETHESIRSMFQSRLLSSLSFLEGKWAYNVILIIEKYETEMIIELSEDIVQREKKVIRLLKKIRKKKSCLEDDTKEELDAFESLLSFTLLQIYSGDAEAVEVIAELQDCYKRLFERNSGDGPPAIEVLVLETRETNAGSQEIYDHDDDKLDDEMYIYEAEDEQESGSTKEQGSDDTDDEYNVNSSDEDIGLQSALAAALQDHAMCDGNESEELMNDEEMLALDSQLINIFKQRKAEKSKKQVNEKARENLVHFKNRVLDLLDLLVRGQNKNKIVLTIILPLLRLSRSTGSDQIREKSVTVLRSLSKTKDLPNDVNVETSLELIKLIHDEASKSKNPLITNVASAVSLMVVKILVIQDKQNVQEVVKVYATSISKWMLNRKSKIRGNLFFDFINWGKVWRESM
ncbi:DNA polymerase V [Neolecta irregularis DAH-3]|uniref:DNA polymerase V n=1 Tax=Neolecta irregularis (strain DAH-3) TaxID=1198029 RepID=A0A1U7LTH4_NEOID|nr:DNA polymerase V [Neolecta irregularis DAH-3]|eukprot:OLL25975.1 DNA polymerase V [Neolecta irregularis DAH-3]